MSESEREGKRKRGHIPAGEIKKCDFCGKDSVFLYGVNGGIWVVCQECMIQHYGGEEE